jgi:hypothetical protein
MISKNIEITCNWLVIGDIIGVARGFFPVIAWEN